jgi:hypothetical protein
LARFDVFTVEFDDETIAKLKTMIVLDKIGDEHGRNLRFEVGQFEDDVRDVCGRSAPAAHAQHLDSLLHED